MLSGLERLRHHPGPGFMEQIPNLQTGAAYHQGGNVLKAYSETIYFFDDAGNMESYLVTRYDYVQGIFREKIKVRIEKKDHKVVKKYLGVHYKSLMKHARRNRLDFETREGLMEIFQEYQRLAGIF